MQRAKAHHLSEGIDIAEEAWQKIAEMAHEVGVRI